MLKSDGAIIARSTLSDSTIRAAESIEIVYDKMNELVMGSNYLQADESSIPVLTKDKPGSTLKGCMLIKVAPKKKLVIFDYIKTKEKVNILNSLSGFQGYLQVDGNVSYDYEELGKISKHGLKKNIDPMIQKIHLKRPFNTC